MAKFSAIEARAAKRKGGAKALEKLLSKPRSRAALAKTPDSFLLSTLAKQRVTISRALLGDPEALLLDEPTAALDPPNAAVVVDTISALQQSRGLTIVAVTHQPELIRRLGGCLLYLVKGRTEAYECIDRVAPAINDGRLRGFLAGERFRAAP
jgi:ABC-type methionine transport system ATPase subunit